MCLHVRVLVCVGGRVGGFACVCMGSGASLCVRVRVCGVCVCVCRGSRKHTNDAPRASGIFFVYIDIFLVYACAVRGYTEEEEAAVNTTMMDLVHDWCSGASFADVCSRSKVCAHTYMHICMHTFVHTTYDHAYMQTDTYVHKNTNISA